MPGCMGVARRACGETGRHAAQRRATCEEVLRHLEAMKTRADALSTATLPTTPEQTATYARRLIPRMGIRARVRPTMTGKARRLVPLLSALQHDEETEADLDRIDVCAITPLDALNLLFSLQKRRSTEPFQKKSQSMTTNLARYTYQFIHCRKMSRSVSRRVKLSSGPSRW